MIGSGGAIIAGPGDQYIVSGDYNSASTQTAEWNTTGALLDFTGGGTHSVDVTSPSSSLFAWGTMQVDSANTAYISGNGLVAFTTSNSGSIQQISGSSSLGTVLGNGSLTVGGAGSAAQVTVTSFSQATMSVADLGKLAVSSAVSAVTNSAATLSITGSGVLDLANSALITTTPYATVQQYLTNGYNGGAWNGTGGISSANAAADAALGTNGVGKALGFVSGTSNFGMNLGLASNQTLAKYTIYGDSNLDGVVNILDFGAFSANFGHTGVGWEEGDYNYDGVVNILDFGKLSANFGHSATATVAMGGASVNTTLTGAKASTSASTVKPAATPAGSGVSVVVNTTTGDVHLAFNNIQSRGYEIDSPSGEMNTFDQFDTPPGPAMLLSDGNIPANDNRGNKYWIELSSDGDPTRLAEGLNTGYHFSTLPTINQTFDLGDIYVGPSGTNVPDLSVLYVDGLGNGFQQVVQYVGVPEPTTLGLLGLAAAGLVARRRKSK